MDNTLEDVEKKYKLGKKINVGWVCVCQNQERNKWLTASRVLAQELLKERLA